MSPRVARMVKWKWVSHGVSFLAAAGMLVLGVIEQNLSSLLAGALILAGAYSYDIMLRMIVFNDLLVRHCGEALDMLDEHPNQYAVKAMLERQIAETDGLK